MRVAKLGVLGSVLLTAFCAMPSTAGDQTNAVGDSACENADEVTVSATNFAFTPSSVEIEVGGSVVWTNNGGSHTTTEDYLGQDQAAIASITKTIDEPIWDREIPVSGSIGIKFCEPGVYEYHCEVHRFMRGKITVNAGG